LNVLDFLRLQPVLSNLHFVIIYNKARRGEDVSQILYLLGMKFVFLYFGIKSSFAKILEYFFYIPVMFGHIIQVDKYIIQIDHDTDI